MLDCMEQQEIFYLHTLTYTHICTLATSMSHIYTDMVVQIHRYISFYLNTCTCVHMHVFINTMCTHTHTFPHTHAGGMLTESFETAECRREIFSSDRSSWQVFRASSFCSRLLLKYCKGINTCTHKHQ